MRSLLTMTYRRQHVLELTAHQVIKPETYYEVIDHDHTLKGEIVVTQKDEDFEILSEGCVLVALMRSGGLLYISTNKLKEVHLVSRCPEKNEFFLIEKELFSFDRIGMVVRSIGRTRTTRFGVKAKTIPDNDAQHEGSEYIWNYAYDYGRTIEGYIPLDEI